MPKDRRRKRARPVPTACPCGSKRPYAECCGPLHDGAREAADAVELMRSRYSAFCLGRGDYLWKTLHSQHEARAAGEQAYRESVEGGTAGIRGRELRILDSTEADAQGVAQVLFYADIAYHRRGKPIVELSSFALEDGKWRYITGITRRAADLAHGVDDLSIAHWDCGHHHHH
ncbi:MAG: YchJ family metal-binding protein [Myxococcales bacterium]|jgi:SEC-C motif-containing protein